MLRNIIVEGQKADFDHMWVQGDLTDIFDNKKDVKFIGVVSSYNHGMGKVTIKDLQIIPSNEFENNDCRFIEPDEYTIEFLRKCDE